MPARLKHSGKRFGSVVAIRYIGMSLWECRCDCGNVFPSNSTCLRRGNVTRCDACRLKRFAAINTTHGKSDTPEYRTWASMKKRCYGKSHSSYYRYGGRGIQVCDRWLHNFESFLSDMGIKPSPFHSIERKDSNGDYAPDNCVWATNSTQSSNRSTSRRVTFLGQTLTVTEWENKLGFQRNVLASRLRNGWPIESAFTTPSKRVPKCSHCKFWKSDDGIIGLCKHLPMSDLIKFDGCTTIITKAVFGCVHHDSVRI